MKKVLTLNAIIKFDTEDEAGSFSTSIKSDFFIDMQKRLNADVEQTAKWMVANHYFQFDNVKVISASIEGLEEKIEHIDVAVVAKQMREIIKQHYGVMGCHIKRWKATKAEGAHDVIYISGGTSFKVPHELRLQNTSNIVDTLEQFGLSNDFSIITKQATTGTIWFKRVVKS